MSSNANEIEQRRVAVPQVSVKRSSSVWVIPASVILHVLLIAVIFVQTPSLQQNAVAEPVVSVELLPEPEPPPEEEPAPEPEPPVEPENPPEQPPEPEPEPEPQENVEPAAQPDILPDIAIRPEEARLDAQDRGDSKGNEGEDKPEAPSERVPEEPAPAVSASSSDLLPATAAQGELPAGQEPPVPQEKPQSEPKDQTLEERKPLTNGALDAGGLHQMMGDLSPHRRIVQICSIEALAQIRSTDRAYAGVIGVIPYSDDGGSIEGGTLNARGGAFNLGGRWVEVEFICETDLERYRVLRFSQRIGKALSRDEAKARGFSKYE